MKGMVKVPETLELYSEMLRKFAWGC